jgi:hypothetical protein
MISVKEPPNGLKRLTNGLAHANRRDPAARSTGQNELLIEATEKGLLVHAGGLDVIREVIRKLCVPQVERKGLEPVQDRPHRGA